MKTLLFVCTGNTCRSPMAAALMRRLLEEKGVTGVRCESAGLAAEEGAPASAGTVGALREAGIDLGSHRARNVTPALLGQADAIYTMSPSHAAMLAARAPACAGRIHVLGGGIPDPYGGNIDVYRRCRDTLLAALRAVAREWAP